MIQVCENCKERKETPYVKALENGMAVYYCQPCNSGLDEVV